MLTKIYTCICLHILQFQSKEILSINIFWRYCYVFIEEAFKKPNALIKSYILLTID